MLKKSKKLFVYILFDIFSSGSNWLWVHPQGIRQALNWIKSKYDNKPVYITENGVSDNTGIIQDVHRIDYYRAYINEVLKGNILLYLFWILSIVTEHTLYAHGCIIFSSHALSLVGSVKNCYYDPA